MAVEAAQELCLSIPPIVNTPLETYAALKRQTLFNLRAFYLSVLYCFAALKHLVDPTTPLP
jgi:hypothetical protein